MIITLSICKVSNYEKACCNVNEHYTTIKFDKLQCEMLLYSAWVSMVLMSCLALTHACMISAWRCYITY